MKAVIFIGLNNSQIPYLISIKELGYYVIGIDGNCFAPGVPMVDMYIPYKYNEYEAIEQTLITKGVQAVSGVFTASAQFSHVLASRLANIYELRYPSENLIKTILDKSAFYPLFSEKGLPIPETSYVYTRKDLDIELKRFPEDTRLYIKSDFSKNPKYVYSGTAKQLQLDEINWKIDTHFRRCYVVQPEIPGTDLRINIGKDISEVYIFPSSVKLTRHTDNINHIIEQLRVFCEEINLQDWIVKFDVIDTHMSFVVLDIGIDPPVRMMKNYMQNKQNFARFYVRRYLEVQ